ncbi:hypothetical protein SRB5_26140 [Streptomyces sp. RB5]|uniref:Uncharacterized protein n=1 Tax=Streptomyces smaragdinus TaxID=2585196 RepID=A0A7K0CG73_9ACTN|nr:hypothetical protein [Streptomyces smaragdinus]MQY12480.1 hypothetical protein [Streptomyces smaragdinus]
MSLWAEEQTRSEQEQRVDFVRRSLPAEGLFADKEWRISPEAFAVDAKLGKRLQGFGGTLLRFLRAANKLYLDSAAGREPGWIADYLDAGKPRDLVEHARSGSLANVLPRVIRPDLILTEDGFTLTEIDSVPGGIGLTGWLNETYAALGCHVLGGATGMLSGFHGIAGSADVLVSEESGDYRPEMDWLTRRITEETGSDGGRVRQAESFSVEDARADGGRRPVYRFFELFDLPNIPPADGLMKAEAAGDLVITPPLKPYLEEKAWLALFWMRPLREFWLRELGSRNMRLLQQAIPYTWIIDPAPLPHHGSLPRLEAQSWADVAAFSQRDRELVIKISGFHEDAWGSRSVVVGSDVSQQDWAASIEQGLAGFGTSPRILQVFHKGRTVEQSYYSEPDRRIKEMTGRVRLCPYYFVTEGRADLGGVLATICPADKKIIHGMQDAILAPVVVSRTRSPEVD